MFSYVAKSLLSKTLRTVLSKYLENIELESIDYGSTSSTEAQSEGSGWGVRLSNVKLREGMELMKLPGKRKRVVTSRNKKAKRKDDTSKNASASNDSTPVTKNSKTPEGEVKVVDNNITFDTTDVVIEKEGVLLQPNGLPTSEHKQNRDRLLTPDLEDGYFSSTPTTPTEPRNGFCGVQNTFCHLKRRDVDLQQESNESTIPTQQHNGDKLSSSGAVLENGNGERCRQHKEADDICLESSSSTKAGSTKTDLCEGDDNNTADDDNSLLEEDLALVVGADGVIGTLNIRLIGKELHVTVEDAHLIVEVIPSDLEGTMPQNEELNNSPQPQKTNLDRTTSTSSESDLPNSSADEEKGEATIGEIIKKKSAFARYLSMIPHLFLRDCRVSLILPEMADNESTNDYSDECTVFELGIDFLSVTSGDDFLDVLRFGPSSGASTPLRRSHSVGSEMPSSNSEGKSISRLNSQSFPEYSFQRKRIRTGKGPDGGLWLRIHPPNSKILQPNRARHVNEPKWARRKFLDSSESYFFRCSGIDLHAKMLVDKKEDEVDNTTSAWNSEYEDYTMDSMLFGVDYVDPITLTRHQIKENMRRESSSSDLPSEPDIASLTDSNGIQSIPFASNNIHWIAKGAHRNDCPTSHLPLRDCFYCWNECMNVKKNSNSSMNKIMPLPGFVFCLSVTDPLEVNVDRSSIEALGYMKSLFTSKKPPQQVETETDARDDNDAKNNVADDDAPSAPTCIFDENSFPPYMQPDAVYLSGISVLKVTIRIEAIMPKVSTGLKFRYWQFVGQSIHYEESQVDADDRFLSDIKFHVGRMECKDCSGVNEKSLLTAGIDSDTRIDSGTMGDANEVHLPFSAARVLGVHPFSAVDKQSNSYAAHMRFIRSDVPKEVVGDESILAPKVRYVNLQTGMVDVDLDATLSGDISTASSEAKSIIFGSSTKAKKSKSNTKSDSCDSHTLIQVSTKGGTLSYKPKIKMKIPESKYRMRNGADSGLSFETFLQGLGVEYGSYAFEQNTPPPIMHLCSLPESLRMHILLYLDDLTPLERVLHIKRRKSSAFLRSHAVSKRLTKLALSAKDMVHSQTDAIRRRNTVLSQLQSLDVDSLEALLAMHDRK